MAFGFSVSRWQSCFDDEALAAIRDFVARVNPSQPWEELLAARPTPSSFELWTDFGTHMDLLLEQYGLKAPYDAVYVLPVDFSETLSADEIASSPAAVPLSDPRLLGTTYVLEADYVDRSWQGHRDEEYKYRCHAYAKAFDAWMAGIGSDTESAIAELEARDDAYDIISARLELAWVDAARASVTARCPVSVFW
jgi:hypothetical protein